MPPPMRIRKPKPTSLAPSAKLTPSTTESAGVPALPGKLQRPTLSSPSGKSLWQSFMSLSPRTRMWYWMGLGTFAFVALQAQDWVYYKVLVPREEQQASLRDNQKEQVEN